MYFKRNKNAESKLKLKNIDHVNVLGEKNTPRTASKKCQLAAYAYTSNLKKRKCVSMWNSELFNAHETYVNAVLADFGGLIN